MIRSINVQVGSDVKTYRAMIAEYGEFLVTGQAIRGLSDALSSAKKLLRPDSAWTGAFYWVELDDSGLAYHIEVKRTGTWKIVGASPRQGFDNVRDLYVA